MIKFSEKHPKWEILLPLIESAILSVMLFIKLAVFSKYIKLGSYALPIALSTVFLVLLVFSIIFLFRHRPPILFFVITYAVTSILMFIDALYFSYLGKLPSFAALSMAGNLTAVSDTLIALVTLMHVLLFADLILILMYAIIIRPMLKRRIAVGAEFCSKITKKIPLVISFCAVIISAGMIFTVMITGGLSTKHLKNELYTYHITDLCRVLFPSDQNETVNTITYPSDSDASIYHGVAKGRNVITIQVEALQNFIIGFTYNGQLIAPNLTMLANESSLYFDNYCYQIGGGNTADAEFTVNTSLYAPENSAAYVEFCNEETDLYTLPMILKDNGYSGAYAYHGYEGGFWNRRTAYAEMMGFDSYLALEDLDTSEIVGMGVSDRSVYEQMIKDLADETEPFYAMVITLSSHHPYYLSDVAMRAEVTLLPEHEKTSFGHYLECMRYVDTALGELLNMLKAAGIYENCIINIYGDHMALPNYDATTKEIMTEYVGHEYYLGDMFNVPLIMHIPGLENGRTISTVCGHVDFLPTLLDLLGIKNEKSIMYGRNILTAESGFVAQQTHIGRGSFITDEYVYLFPTNGIEDNAELYALKTGKRIFDYDRDKIAELSAASKSAIEGCLSMIAQNKILIE